MSISQKLKDYVSEFEKWNKDLDERLNKAVENRRQILREQKEQSSRR